MQTQASQPELRALRSLLNAARAEVTVAQSDLVAARTEEVRKRELKAAQLKKDATLGEPAAASVYSIGVMQLLQQLVLQVLFSKQCRLA